MADNEYGLQDLRVAVLATDGVNEAEIVQPMEALKKAGAEVKVIAPHEGELVSMMHFDQKQSIPVDFTLDEVDSADFDALLLPGGGLNADKLRVEPKAQLFVSEFDAQKKPMAIICHAPWLLVSADLVRNRRLTSFFTIKDDIANAGGEWVDQEVATDGNWVTSRKPDDIPAFNQAMIELFAKGKSPSAE